MEITSVELIDDVNRYSEYAWKKYGLFIALSIRGEDFRKAVRAHNMVYNFLECHPSIAIKYKIDQSGEIKYFDVLTMAEKEEKSA